MIVACPVCRVPVNLPEPWPHPGYTCACGAAVAIGAVVAPAAAPASAFDLADEPVRVHLRNRSTVSDAFGQGLGSELGRLFAKLLVGLAGLATVAAAIVIAARAWRPGH